MEIFSNLWLGLETALSLTNLLYCLVGVFLGTAIGVLPGLGPVATIAMLLPVTFGLPPVSALIMLAGIFYGAQYGGSTTAILVNLPGRVILHRHRHGRLPDGPARQGRPSPGHRRHRFLLCRHGLDDRHRALRATPRGPRAAVRPGRLLLSDGAWPSRLDRARDWFAAPRARDDTGRPACSGSSART